MLCQRAVLWVLDKIHRYITPPLTHPEDFAASIQFYIYSIAPAVAIFPKASFVVSSPSYSGGLRISYIH